MRLDQIDERLNPILCFSDTDWWAAFNPEHNFLPRYPVSVETIEECLDVKPSQVDVVLSHATAKRISIPEAALVRTYLLEHSALLDAVMGACNAVAITFGKDAQFELSVYRDPEIQDEYLALYVRQSDYADDFLDTLNRIYRAYSSELTGKSGWFQVTTDFAPPIE